MRAARFYSARDVRIEDVEAPVASQDKVLIEVEWCGICGSDLHEYLNGPFATPSTKTTGPHALTGEVNPVVLGHEMSGRILHAPTGSPFKVGQPVVVDPRLTCLDCSACQQDAGQLCRTSGFLGISGGGGGLSEVVAVDPAKVHVLPDDTDLAVAALIEPMAVAWHAVRRLGPDNFAGIPILIIGGGPIGIAVVYVLKALGADKIIVSEPALGRREFLRQLVLESVDPREVNVAQRARELTDGEGVQFVIDCAGSDKGFETGCLSLRFRGVYANLSMPKTSPPLPAILFIARELTYRAFMAYGDCDFAEVVEAFTQGKFKGFERMITSRLSLEDIVDKGFEVLAQGVEAQVKILATPRKI